MATSTQETKPGTGPMEAKKRNVPWAVLKGLLLGLLALVVKKAYDAGEFRAMEYHGGERCTPWRGAVGMEDVAFYRPPLQKNEKTIAVLSSDVRRYLNLGFDLSGQSFADRIASQKEQGHLWTLSKEDAKGIAAGSSDASPKAVKLVKYPYKDFHPHGIDLLQLGNRTLLFVINHRREGEVIELFEMALQAEPATATFVESITDPLFRNLNDVVVLSTNEFYTTNWLRYEPGTLNNLYETALQKPISYVVHCRRATVKDAFYCHVAAEKITMANSLVYDATKQKLFVTASTSKTIHEFTPMKNGTLRLDATYDTNSMCDNMLMDDAGRIWMGCHPKGFTFMLHGKHLLDKAPSNVLVFDPSKSAGQGQLREFFLSDGSDLPGSSVAAPWGDLFLVGSVRGDGLLVCDNTAFNERS